jgi:solute:Na+ symporter, SSS family
MQLELIDWILIVAYFLAVIAVGLLVARVAGKNSGEFFLGGRQMPWWLLGFSMVATTFSTDTPNLVTGFGGHFSSPAWSLFSCSPNSGVAPK